MTLVSRASVHDFLKVKYERYFLQEIFRLVTATYVSAWVKILPSSREEATKPYFLKLLYDDMYAGILSIDKFKSLKLILTDQGK